jgi:hypothetical protein
MILFAWFFRVLCWNPESHWSSTCYVSRLIATHKHQWLEPPPNPSLSNGNSPIHSWCSHLKNNLSTIFSCHVWGCPSRGPRCRDDQKEEKTRGCAVSKSTKTCCWLQLKRRVIIPPSSTSIHLYSSWSSTFIVVDLSWLSWIIMNYHDLSWFIMINHDPWPCLF